MQLLEKEGLFSNFLNDFLIIELINIPNKKL
jgi:hypothetical protein